MQIEKKSNGDLLELSVAGVLDNESAMDLRAAIDNHVREGWHRIVVHMHGVSYISSAGINVLIMTKRRLEQLEGMFGICSPSPEVERILTQTRVLSLLLCDVEKARAAPIAGAYTVSLSSRIARDDGLDMQIFELDDATSLLCEVQGDFLPLFDFTFTESNCRTVEFSDESFAIGLGALGDDFDSVHHQFGEFLAVAGAVAQSSQSRRQLPDYSMSRGDFVPRANVLYGIRCEGRFSQLIRFQSVESAAPVALSTVVTQCLQQSQYTSAGIVLLAETAGLLGARLRRSPATLAVTPVERFDFPEIRNWLSFSPERVYSRNLALIVGIAKVSGPDQPSSPVDPLLRPLTSDGGLHGHFHAAVFPYRPLKKRTLDFYASIRELFESGTIQDVLHLLRDDRPTVGVGESELLGGGVLGLSGAPRRRKGR